MVVEVAAPGLLVALAWLAIGRLAPSLGGPWERLVPSVVLAFAGASIAFFWWRIVGLPADAFPALVTGSALAVAALPARSGTTARSPLLSTRPTAWAGAVAAVGAIVLSVPRLLRQPLGEYDAIAIWNVRAATLWRADEPLGPLFGRLVGSHAHPDYPLLLPGGLASAFGLAGGDNPVTPQIVSVLFLLTAAGSVWLGLGRLGAGSWAPLATALFLLTPEVLFWGPAQCADLLLAALLALSAASLALLLRAGPPRWPAWFAGACLSLLPWAKNEGLLLAAGLLALWLAVAAATGRPLRPHLPAFALGAAPATATLLAFKDRWSPHVELPDFVDGALGRALEPTRWRVVTAAFWNEWNPVTGHSEWGLVWLVLLVAGVSGWLAVRRSGPDRLFLRGAVAGTVVLWFGVYLGTPADLRWHLDTSFDRLLLQLLPTALIWAYGELPALGRSASPDRHAP